MSYNVLKKKWHQFYLSVKCTNGQKQIETIDFFGYL